MQQQDKLPLFKNKQGTLFAVLGTATDVDSKQEIIIYKNIQSNKIWVRPQVSFDEVLDDGSKRFTPINESMTLSDVKDLFHSLTT